MMMIKRMIRILYLRLYFLVYKRRVGQMRHEGEEKYVFYYPTKCINTTRIQGYLTCNANFASRTQSCASQTISFRWSQTVANMRELEVTSAARPQTEPVWKWNRSLPTTALPPPLPPPELLLLPAEAGRALPGL